jgi:MoxR-like ATPase
MVTQQRKVKTMAKGKTVQKKFAKLQDQLNANVFERVDVIVGLIVALLAGTNVALLGPAGIAKSYLIVMLASAFKDGSYFEYLLSKFTSPAEIMGPVKFSAMKNDSFERAVDNYLPTSNFAFLDEVFKCNSALLNALLTLINEKKYRNGTKLCKSPLASVFGASNELPEDKDGNLAALWDRFPIKYWLPGDLEDANLLQLMEHEANGTKGNTLIPFLTMADLQQAQDEVAKVPFPVDVLNRAIAIKNELKQGDHRVSPRTMARIVRILQAYAWLCGDAEVTADHLTFLGDVLWTDPADTANIQRLVAKMANPLKADVTAIMDCATEQFRTVPLNLDPSTIDNPDEVENVCLSVRRILRQQLAKLEELQNGKANKLIDRAGNEIADMIDQIKDFEVRV